MFIVEKDEWHHHRYALRPNLSKMKDTEGKSIGRSDLMHLTIVQNSLTKTVAWCNQL